MAEHGIFPYLSSLVAGIALLALTALGLLHILGIKWGRSFLAKVLGFFIALPLLLALMKGCLAKGEIPGIPLWPVLLVMIGLFGFALKFIFKKIQEHREERRKSLRRFRPRERAPLYLEDDD